MVRKRLFIFFVGLCMLVVLSAQNRVYKNVLVIGNSITTHGYLPSRGWYGYSWGMAATTDSTDFCSLLKKQLQNTYPNVYVSRLAAQPWEQKLTVDAFLTALGNMWLAGRDCIILRLCENISSDSISSIEKSLHDLIDYIESQNATADIFLTGTIMMNEYNPRKNEIIKKVAEERGLTYVDIYGDESMLERLGDYVPGYPENSEGRPDYTVPMQLYPIVDVGVAGHPNDCGHLHIANQLLQAMGYEFLEIEHEIKVIDDENMGYICFQRWVAGGLFNVQTTAIPTVQDETGQEIAVIKAGEGAYLFVMPDCNVTITLSSTNAISHTMPHLIKQEFFTIDGYKVTEPARSFVVVKSYYDDGQVTVTKKYIK